MDETWVQDWVQVAGRLESLLARKLRRVNESVHGYEPGVNEPSLAEVLDSLSSRWRAYQNSAVDQVVSPVEDMLPRGLPNAMGHYMGMGVSALESVATAMLLARRTSFERILDLPCGGGRVTRHLCVFFPDAEIVVSDLDKSKQAAVVGQFSVAGLDIPAKFIGRADPTFDLIFVGSLFTHLNSAAIERALRFLLASLADEGILVLTTHGRDAVGHILARQRTRSRVLGTVANLALNVWFPRTGYLYRGSDGQVDYGTSLTMPSWVIRRVERDAQTRLLGFKEGAWGDHQDVMILQKRAKSTRGRSRRGDDVV